MPDNKCIQPSQLLREVICEAADMLEKASSIAEVIEDRLFGSGLSENCDKAIPPQNVWNGADKSVNLIRKLVIRLEVINSRL